MRSRRGYALQHVLVAVAVAAALAAGWAPAFRVALLSSARGASRAEARALANAAWAHARIALERGADPRLRDQDFLNGRASIELKGDRERQTVRVNARVSRHGDWIHSRLEIVLRIDGSGNSRRVIVLKRTELGA